MLKVYLKARSVFGSNTHAIRWLLSKNRALGNVRPISLVLNRSTKQNVLDILGRIEYGIYT